MRIAVFTSDMKIGGIQRALFTLLCSNVMEEHKVDLFVFDDNDNYDLSELPRNITVNRMKPLPYWSKAVPFKIVRKFYESKIQNKFEQYDISIDYNGYNQECAIAALSIDAPTKIIWVHNDYQKRIEASSKFHLMFWAFKSKYQFFDKIVAVSQGVIDALSGLINIDSDIAYVIPNLIDENKIKEKISEADVLAIDKDATNIVFLGRLAPAKNVGELLGFFSQAVVLNDSIRLHIVGDGPDKEKLQTKTAELNIEPYVTFWGSQSNPYPLLSKMDALVLNSLYEGQGIVLREAQSFGIPVIFPTRLEKYNEGLFGTDDMVSALANVSKKDADPNVYRLEEYNTNIEQRLQQLLFGKVGGVS